MQKNKKNFIVGITTLLWTTVFLSGCQSNNIPKGSASGSIERPLHVIRSFDGVQNKNWKIVEVLGQKPHFFVQQPSLYLNAQNSRIQGHTGCNGLWGSYKINTQTKQLNVEAKAGHQSCDQALPQEANLMDALSQIHRFELQGTQIWFFNAQGKRVLVGQA